MVLPGVILERSQAFSNNLELHVEPQVSILKSMISILVAGEFFAASFLLALAPGPDNLFVVTHAAVHGVRSGWLVTCGLCTGLLVHTAVVAGGLAAALAARPDILTGLKWVGAGYLLYLAWHAFRTAASATGETPAAPAALPPRALYRRGVWMNLTNPKVALFFAAFLPQFVQHEAGPSGQQVATLGALFAAATLLVFGGLSTAAGLAGHTLLQRPSAQHLLHLAAGLVFVLLAGSVVRGS